MKRDLVGMRFGCWLVLCVSSNKPRGHGIPISWLCICDCGTMKDVQGGNLTNGTTTNCGCKKSEKSRINATKHGMRYTSEYQSWAGMIKRCYNKKCQDYYLYGERGISVCDEWRKSFQAFYDHIGNKPSKNHSLDRINNDGNYEPGNIRWATIIEQANNRRNNVRRIEQ